MKILSIRGENCASLAGPFDINLAEPPLANAGIIAITGKTGAGKSTILDAMCLALFDQMPRLAQRSTLQQDQHGLSVTDVRQILRRGATHASCEVEFIGIDQHIYRATWQVRRARLKTDGRIQHQTMQLQNISTEQNLTGHTKSETLQKIECKLGLNFAQFTRAVLLAQGDFARFLDADEKSRADLLARMTNSEIFSEISQYCHQRAKKEATLTETILSQLNQITRLTSKERNILKTQLNKSRSLLDQLQHNHQQLAPLLQWHQQEQQLHQQYQTAAAHYQQRHAEAPTWQKQQAQFQARINREPLYHAQAAMTDSEKALHNNRKAQHQAEQALEKAHAIARSAEQALHQAEKHYDQLADTLQTQTLTQAIHAVQTASADTGHCLACEQNWPGHTTQHPEAADLTNTRQSLASADQQRQTKANAHQQANIRVAQVTSQLELLTQQHDTLTNQHRSAIDAFEQACQAAGVAPESLPTKDDCTFAAAQAALEKLATSEQALQAAEIRHHHLAEQYQTFQNTRPLSAAETQTILTNMGITSQPDPHKSLQQAMQLLSHNITANQSDILKHEAQLAEADQAEASYQHLNAQYQTQQAIAADWETMRQLIGSADGRKFAQFAQQMNLAILIDLANDYLAQIFPRYRLARHPDRQLVIHVVDLQFGGDIRAIQSLSGGERFVIALSLALGLSGLSGSQVPIQSLFIDEGFGVLDEQTLDLVVNSLNTLQLNGRQIVLISHLESIHNRIGQHITLTPTTTQNASRVSLPA